MSRSKHTALLHPASDTPITPLFDLLADVLRRQSIDGEKIHICLLCEPCPFQRQQRFQILLKKVPAPGRVLFFVPAQRLFRSIQKQDAIRQTGTDCFQFRPSTSQSFPMLMG